MSEILLEGKNLTREFPYGNGQKIHAVSDVSVQLRRGETLGLVGESGCGKSTLARLLLRLLNPDSGEIWFCGEKISGMKEKEFRPFRKRMQMIFQDPYASLDPRMSVRDILAEPLETWRIGTSRRDTDRRVLELLRAVNVTEEALRRYPHQFSGGQRQRIGIARALATDPELIVCDEPVSALDMSVQNQILNLLRDLQQERKLTYLFISHDLHVVRYLSDRICVMFLGQICETGPAEEVFSAPLHPYTSLLINSIPQPDPHSRGKAAPLPDGEMPSSVNPPSGCRFRTRCPRATERCAKEKPPLRHYGNREAACHDPLTAVCGKPVTDSG